MSEQATGEETHETASEDRGSYDTVGLSPGGQVYTNTEIGKFIYGGWF